MPDSIEPIIQPHAQRNVPFEVEPIGPTIGAELHGIDLSKPLDRDTFAFLERHVPEHPRT